MSDRISELEEILRSFGDKSFEHYRVTKALGCDIIQALDAYVSSTPGRVFGVPPKGDWEPELGDARDASFSTYNNKLLNLADVEFGVCFSLFRSGNYHSTWLRMPCVIRKNGNEYAVSARASSESDVRVPLEYSSSDISRVCEHIWHAAIKMFKEPIQLFDAGSNLTGEIGFLSRPSK